jgi:hypothetical protein
MAAAPSPAPVPQRGDEPAQANQDLKLPGWLSQVTGSSPGDDARLRLVTVNGTFDVLVTDKTQIRSSKDGAPLPAASLAVALPADVQGAITPAAELRADVIAVGELPPTLAAAAMTVRGRVLAAFGRSAVTGNRQLLVVTGVRGEAVVEVIPETVLVTSTGAQLTYADLKPGQAVTVRALGTTQAVVRAESIEVSMEGHAPTVDVPGVLRARGDGFAWGERWIVGDVLVRVPPPLAREQARVATGTQVSVTARRAEDGELEATKVRVVTKTQPAQLVDLRGHIEKLDAASIVVDGVTVARSGETAAPPSLAVGMYVRVRARMDADGRFTAERVQVLPSNKVDVQFEGPIEVLGFTEWRVVGPAGRLVTVHITGGTVVTGDVPAVGYHAEVTGSQLRDRSVEAARIAVAASVTPASWAVIEGKLLSVGPAPATWTMIDRNNNVTEVVVTEATVIEETVGSARLGAWVSVRGRRSADNQVEAVLIKVLLRSAK